MTTVLRLGVFAALLASVVALTLALSWPIAWVVLAAAFALPLFWWAAAAIPAIATWSWPNFKTWLRRQPDVWALRARLWFHARVPLLFAAALILLAPLSWRTAPGLLGNLFILDRPIQFAVVGFMSMAVSLMILLTFRVVELNAQERFADFDAALKSAFGGPPPAPPDAWSGRRLWLSFFLALPIPLSCLCRTYFLPPAGSWREVLFAVLWLLLGLALAWLVCLLAVIVETFLPAKDPNPNAPDVLPFERLPWFVAKRAAYLAGKTPDSPSARLLEASLGPGYATVVPADPAAIPPTPDMAWIRSGHRQNLLCGGFTLAVYVISYIGWRAYGVIGWSANGGIPSRVFPPIFYILLLFLLLGFVLHGLAFWLDRYRVPTLVFAAVASFVAFLTFHTDHYYELNPIAPSAPLWEHVGPGFWELFRWVTLILVACLAILVGRAFGKTYFRTPAQPFTAGFAHFKRWWALLPAGWALLFLFILVADWLNRPTLAAEAIHVKPVFVEPMLLRDVFETSGGKKGWRFGGKPTSTNAGKTLVVVTAEGGGIQASAWATQVLTGLHQRYGKEFTRSIGLISGVSGGGVGAMYFLANWKADGDDPLPGDACKHINQMAQEGCLEASAWGMTFPDFLRFGMPPLIPKEVDRGWAQEINWRGTLQRFGDKEVQKRAEDWRLSDLRAAAKAGRAPVPVFNATLVETGQRLIISPVSKEAELPPEDRIDVPVEFLPLFKDEPNNLRVTTAARLSAGFAYVSPVCTADRELLKIAAAKASKEARAAGNKKLADDIDYRETLKNAHVVDGGYVDNEGAFTVVDWIDALMRQYRDPQGERPFDRVVIIRIRSFPPWYKASSPGLNGWTDEFWGPMTALQSVRVASQAERNTKILDLLNEANNLQKERNRDLSNAAGLVQDLSIKSGQWLGVQNIKDAGPWINKSLERSKMLQSFDLPVKTIEFSFTPTTDDKPPKRDKKFITPLSWSLTVLQKREITKAWKSLCDQTIPPDGDGEYPLKELDDIFERQPSKQ